MKILSEEQIVANKDFSILSVMKHLEDSYDASKYSDAHCSYYHEYFVHIERISILQFSLVLYQATLQGKIEIISSNVYIDDRDDVKFVLKRLYDSAVKHKQINS